MTPLFKKLNWKTGLEITIISCPTEIENEIEEIKKFSSIVYSIENSKAEFVLLFVQTINDIQQLSKSVLPKMKGDAIIWFCYPKGTSKKYKSEVSRDNGWEDLKPYNIEPVRAVAIDIDWSALRFRKVEFIKKLKRSKNWIISEDGLKKSMASISRKTF